MGSATEYLMQFNSDLNAGLSSGVTFELVTAPEEEPLTLTQIKDNLRLRHNRFDELLTRILPEARQWIEMATGQMFIEQTWRQIHNGTGSLLVGLGRSALPFSRASNIVNLHLEKARSIVSVKVWPTMQSTSMTTIDSDDYFLSGQSLIPRTTWPSTRGVGGFEVEYKVGHGLDAANFASAGMALPLRRALDFLVAYMFENPGDNTSFEATTAGRSALRLLPPEAMQLLEPYIRYEL